MNYSDQPQNPFAPPETDALPDSFERESPVRLRSLYGSLLVWSFVCAVSAVPSFVWGYSSIAADQMLAMLAGIGVFIVAYTVGDQITQRQPWRQRRETRLALKIGYGTRLGISIIFPIGAFLDMFCGIISISASSAIFGEPFADQTGFAFCFATTLIQGTILNIIVATYTGIVFGIIVAIRNARNQD